VKNNIKSRSKWLDVPRYVAIIARRLNMSKQPTKGSSFYKKPSKERQLAGQEDWDCPVGTLRFSNHWSIKTIGSIYKGINQAVFQTDVDVPKRAWILCINTGKKPKPWKVLQVFLLDGTNIIRSINFQEIEDKIRLELKQCA